MNNAAVVDRRYIGLVNQFSLTIATRNSHKTKEIRRFSAPEFTVQDLSANSDVPEIAETGKTFEENAILKAVAVNIPEHVSGLVLADDSGLEVDALNGAPGVYSARYARSGDDRDNVQKLLQELERVSSGKQRREARFQCVLAVACNGKLLKTFAGMIAGTITDYPRGSHGFGYDPVFVPNGFAQTFSELPAQQKNQLSHRGRALAAAIPFLQTQKPGAGK